MDHPKSRQNASFHKHASESLASPEAPRHDGLAKDLPRPLWLAPIDCHSQGGTWLRGCAPDCFGTCLRLGFLLVATTHVVRISLRDGLLLVSLVPNSGQILFRKSPESDRTVRLSRLTADPGWREKSMAKCSSDHGHNCPYSSSSSSTHLPSCRDNLQGTFGNDPSLHKLRTACPQRFPLRFGQATRLGTCKAKPAETCWVLSSNICSLLKRLGMGETTRTLRNLREKKRRKKWHVLSPTRPPIF